MLNLIYDSTGGLMAWFYSIWPSYGMSVVFITLAVMVFVTPLTLKSTKSMLQMQRLQPELKAIQNRYKDDRQKMNEELMAFYQENGINPLGGCLPLLIQAPVFLVLYRVVRGLTRRANSVGDQLGWMAGGGKGLTSITSIEHVFDPQNVARTSKLYLSLRDSREMLSWGIDLSRSASEVMSESLVSALPYFVLIGVVLVSSIYQQRQIQGRNTGAQVNPQQQMIMKVMPFLLPVFSFTLPAALVVYFVVSNVYRIGQQGYITHSLYSGEDSLGAQVAKQRTVDADDDKTGKAKGSDTATEKSSPERSRSGGTAGSPGKKDLSAKRLKSERVAKEASADEAGSAENKSGSAKNKSGSAKNKQAKAGRSPAAGGKSRGRSAKPAGTKRDSSGGDDRRGGRPSRAPSRAKGGRTTDPGSPQYRKRKK